MELTELDYWRLCDQLNIYQAAHLIIGMIPGEVEAMAEVGTELTPKSHRRYTTNLDAATTALRGAISRGKLITCDGFFDQPAPNFGCLDDPLDGLGDEFSWENVTISTSALRDWLISRGVTSGFFFEGGEETPDYLDPHNPRYAPKLAAAVRAWQAVSDLKGKSPKQALSKWLREHASEFGLTDDEGKPNETGIEESSKVANWQPGGGAPKTPTA